MVSVDVLHWRTATTGSTDMEGSGEISDTDSGIILHSGKTFLCITWNPKWKESFFFPICLVSPGSTCKCYCNICLNFKPSPHQTTKPVPPLIQCQDITACRSTCVHLWSVQFTAPRLSVWLQYIMRPKVRTNKQDCRLSWLANLYLRDTGQLHWIVSISERLCSLTFQTK